MARLSTFIIGLVIVSSIMGIFGIGMALLSDSYGVADSSGDIAVYNQLTSLHNQTEEVKSSTLKITDSGNVLDVIGGFFGNAYSALKIILNSLATFFTMSNAAVDDMGLGAVGDILSTMIMVIIIVTVIIGIVLAILLKTDKT